MCSYNSVNGIPACAGSMTQQLLRDALAWDGHVVSDCAALEFMFDAHYDECPGDPACVPGAPGCCAGSWPGTICCKFYMHVCLIFRYDVFFIYNFEYTTHSVFTSSIFFTGHNYTEGSLDTINLSLLAGTDVNCGYIYQFFLKGFLEQAKVSKDAVDLAVTRVYKTAGMLGLLDPSDPSGAKHPYPLLGAEVVDNPSHRALSLTAAQKSIVLLKNNGEILPLKGKKLKLAFIGPHANSTQALISRSFLIFILNYYKLVESMSLVLTVMESLYMMIARVFV